MEFFREAPTGSIVLVVLGAIMVIFVSSWVQLATARRKQAVDRQRAEGGPPTLVRKDDVRRAASTALAIRVAGYGLMGIGFALCG